MLLDPTERQRLGIVSQPNQPVHNRGKQLIVLHCMDERGFLLYALHTNVTDGMLSDYHKDINADTFEV